MPGLEQFDLEHALIRLECDQLRNVVDQLVTFLGILTNMDFELVRVELKKWRQIQNLNWVPTVVCTRTNIMMVGCTVNYSSLDLTIIKLMVDIHVVLTMGSIVATDVDGRSQLQHSIPTNLPAHVRDD